ncbi:MAG: hypothetical protein R3F53_08720 [Gammaproteobacteria bacterium]
MLKRISWTVGCAAALLLSQSALAAWQNLNLKDVDIDIVSDRYQRSLPEFPVEQRGKTYRAYLEAEQGAEYSIRVHNRSDQRIGLVIAVDGRNIISGDRSELRPNERMYILNPYQQATYRGWRTGKNQVNRFYFTEAPDSYAGRWGDYSAMGVIAVAAYAEDRPQHTYKEKEYSESFSDRAQGSGTGPNSFQKSAPAAEPGTGFGDRERSPSRRVEFDPEHSPFGRYFIKYEWRSTLCEKGLVRCGREQDSRRQDNRFWNNNDYAPYPPGMGHWRNERH